MRAKRIIGLGDSCYHVLSRINEKRFYLGHKEKAVFRDLLRRSACFSGVEVLTFCIMSNHFHILVRVPERIKVSDAELIKRLKALYRQNEWKNLVAELEGYVRDGDERMRRVFRERYLRRMYDLTEFVRTLKLRFSMWYNYKNDRVGPLWDDRFKSVLVQSSGDEQGMKALSVMAAYIDLNAVRAAIVDDPEDYPWCGFAEAVAGDMRALEGIRYIFRRSRGMLYDESQALLAYRTLLYVLALGDGDGLSENRIRQVQDVNENMSVGALLRCKVRCFSYGRILGSSPFVDGLANARSECFVNYRGARRVDDLPSMALYTGSGRIARNNGC